jgi:heme o synthase
LVKPGIVRGNAVSTIAGFFLASSLEKTFKPDLLLGVLVGSSLVIACGCVINNLLDRGIDARMDRTKKRALVTKEISVRSAIFFASLLGLVGFLTLAMFVNATTVYVGALGLFFYLVPYSYFKRRSSFGTVVGSVSGSTPIVAGYTAIAGVVDAGGVLLFLCMAAWQMPHFYSIALYRRKDYANARIPVLPVEKGVVITKFYVRAYIIAFAFSCVLLTLLGYTGYAFAAIMLVIAAWWLLRGKDLDGQSSEKWGKRMFLSSLLVLLLFCTAVSVGALLP